MPGQGKYTTYYNNAFANNEDKKVHLESVFSNGVFTTEGGPYNQEDVVKVGNSRILAIGSDTESGEEFKQVGDSGMFPDGVYLDFRGTVGAEENLADVSTVGWKKAGDPLNPYVPDVRSPGPADGIDLADTSTNVISTNVDASNGDPRIDDPGALKETTAFKPNYDPSEAEDEKFDNSGTRNPIVTGRTIHSVAAVSVDRPLKLGESMRHLGDA